MIDIAIIGGGPAGLAAGLYAARSGVKCALFEEMFVGGQAAKTNQIDNYPGFAQGIDGYTLGINMEQQAKRFGLEIFNGNISSLILGQDPKRIVCDGIEHEALSVIIATGATPRKLGVDGEERFTGSGVSYCATCDGAFFKGMTVAVVGGGDTAVSDAVFIARFAKDVYLIHRRDQLRASHALERAAKSEDNIHFIWNSVVTGLHGDARLSGIKIQNLLNQTETDMKVDGLFVAVGITPNSKLVEGQLELNEGGYIVTDPNMRASVKGVYAAGDVRNTPLRQIVTAVADGAVAATTAAEDLLV